MKQPPGDRVPLQVGDERLADRGQLARPRERPGRLHDLFVEDPGRRGHGGQLKLLPGARRHTPAKLAPARAAARVLAESPSGPSSVASDAAARRIASRLRLSGHASLIALAT
jgi:hypothetical protein